MIVCQVDAWLNAMRKEDVERELDLLGEVMEALEGELISAEVSADNTRLLAYLRVESELQASDIFEVFHFSVERIACLGWSAEPRADISRPPGPGAWRYLPPCTGKEIPRPAVGGVPC